MLRRRKYITEQKTEKMIDEVSVFFVDGEDVRNKKDIEFTLGGHHWRYDFIPEKEIWVEKTKPENRGGVACLICHELVERFLQKYLGLDYDEAHDVASAAEEGIRKAIKGKQN